jgi:hypothetical protein
MEILGLVLLVLLSGVTLIALLAAVNLILPGPVGKARQQMEAPLGRPFLLGLINLLFFGAVAVVFVWLAGLIRDQWQGAAAILAVVLSLLALILLLGIAVLTLNGLVALASLLGTRIGKVKSPFRSDLQGSLLLILACATPYLGWYLFTPVIACISLGASAQAFFQRKPKTTAAK